MRKTPLIAIASLSCLFYAEPALAQVTNFLTTAPLTKLESLQTNIAVVILKAGTEMGSVAGESGFVAVRCREITDTSTGHKEQGIAIEVTQRDRLRDTMLIDYDELASLINAIDYLTKLEVSVTPLDTFDAAYTTKGGLRIAALGTRRSGAVQFALRDARAFSTPVIFSREQMSRFSALINQAKGTLDSLSR